MKTIDETCKQINKWREQRLDIGLVPTMGFLHEGHLSLVRKALQDNDKIVVSIFVNPTQFGPNEDLNQYPRDLERDLELLKSVGCDAVFLPANEEMYPAGFSTQVKIEGISDILIGRFRPGHFAGVATVCSKLFSIITPDRAYFGQKDYQQVQIIKRLVNDLNFNLDIVMLPIVREPDGLALSSRNVLLNSEVRLEAPQIYRSVQQAMALFERGERASDVLCAAVREILIREAKLLKIAYVEIVDPATLKSKSTASEGDVLLVEVYAGKIRLYDNQVF